MPLLMLRGTPPAATQPRLSEASLNQEEKRKDEKPAQISIEEAVKFAAQVPLSLHPTTLDPNPQNPPAIILPIPRTHRSLRCSTAYNSGSRLGGVFFW